MLQNLLDYCRVLNTSDHIYLSTAVPTDFYVDVGNHSFTPLPVGDLNTPTYSTVGNIRQFPDGSDIFTTCEFDELTPRIAF